MVDPQGSGDVRPDFRPAAHFGVFVRVPVDECCAGISPGLVAVSLVAAVSQRDEVADPELLRDGEGRVDLRPGRLLIVPPVQQVLRLGGMVDSVRYGRPPASLSCRSWALMRAPMCA